MSVLRRSNRTFPENHSLSLWTDTDRHGLPQSSLTAIPCPLCQPSTLLHDTRSPIAKQFSTYEAPQKKSKIEISVLVLLTASLLITVVQKFFRGGLIYLLQPCHMSAMLLITILTGPKNKKWPHILLNVYFHIMWGT